MLERLRCGIIVTETFIQWLKAWKTREGGANFGLIAELNYVKCREGERAGQSWVSLVWRPLDGVKPHELFEVGTVRLFFPKQTRQALKERCLDIREDRIIVI